MSKQFPFSSLNNMVLLAFYFAQSSWCCMMMTVGHFVVHHHCHTVQSSWLGTQTKGGFVDYVALLTSAVFTTDRERGSFHSPDGTWGHTRFSGLTVGPHTGWCSGVQGQGPQPLWDRERREERWMATVGLLEEVLHLSLKWSIAVWVPWRVTHWKTLILAES